MVSASLPVWNGCRNRGQESADERMAAGAVTASERLAEGFSERFVWALRCLPAVYVLLGVCLATDAGVGPWNLSFWGVVAPLIGAVELALWYWRTAE